MPFASVDRAPSIGEPCIRQCHAAAEAVPEEALVVEDADPVGARWAMDQQQQPGTRQSTELDRHRRPEKEGVGI